MTLGPFPLATFWPFLLQFSRWALVMLSQFAGLGLLPLGVPSVTDSASASALAPVACAAPTTAGPSFGALPAAAASAPALPICQSSERPTTVLAAARPSMCDTGVTPPCCAIAATSVVPFYPFYTTVSAASHSSLFTPGVDASCSAVAANSVVLSYPSYADEARVRPPDVAGNGLRAAADGGGQKGGGGKGLGSASRVHDDRWGGASRRKR